MKFLVCSMLLAGTFAAFEGYTQDTSKRRASPSRSRTINTEEENRKYGNTAPGRADSISGNTDNTRDNNMPEKSSVTSPERNMKVPKEGTKIDNNPNRNAIGR